ncbi:MAG: AmmeMemoRadiSam system radical SAM enzyme [Lentisphaeria bacterium]|nr:AmmeMemoRadiSam system radical SAM enzyme [Lentisphaeria bacterium]
MNHSDQQARWWDTDHTEPAAIRCRLCPRQCLIHNGKRGFCQVRSNRNGILFADTYGYPVAIQIDPIEKKPLHHFLPGSKTFSIGTFGCNLSCSFCQNDSLSSCGYPQNPVFRKISPQELIQAAIQNGCLSVAFTYNEPTVFAEYAQDTAEEAHRHGLKTIFVTNGFITEEAAAEIYPLIDAANIDMKGFSEEFYRSMCAGRLHPVLQSIKKLYQLEKHIELTNLVIPGKNDSTAMIDLFLDWVEQELDREIPLHFSAYHPAARFRAAPPTPPGQLRRIGQHATERGFKYVHLGNI